MQYLIEMIILDKPNTITSMLFFIHFRLGLLVFSQGFISFLRQINICDIPLHKSNSNSVHVLFFTSTTHFLDD